MPELNYTDDYQTLSYMVIYALALVGGIWGICLYAIQAYGASRVFVTPAPGAVPDRNLSATVRRGMAYWSVDTLEELDELMERLRRER
jgi:hypothetical protein